MGNHIESTVRTIDTGVQTESFKRFRLNSCEAERKLVTSKSICKT